MRIETVKRVYKKFEELTEERQREIIENLTPDDLQMYFDDISETFEDQKIELIDNLIENNKYFNVKDFYIEDSSQGWYFVRGQENYLNYNRTIELKNDNNYYELYIEFDKYNGSIDEILIDNTFYTLKELKELKIKDINIDNILKVAKNFIIGLNNLIDNYINYYPTFGEIKEDYIINEVEFLEDEKIIREVE